MTRLDAIKRLTKLIGPAFGWREHKGMSSTEAREKAHADCQRFRALYKAADEQREARRRELLADPVYQELAAKAKALREQTDEAQASALYYRIRVGTRDSLFFHVTAQGDNWADVVRKVEAAQEAKSEHRAAASGRSAAAGE